MTRTAIITGKVVDNVILTAEDWAAPDDVTAVECGPEVAPGWTYDNDTFSPPAPPAKTGLMPVAIWFLRLTVEEVAKFNLLETQVRALTPADYEDPAKLGLVQWGVFLTHFHRLTNDIDLTHPLVVQGIGLFAQLIGMADERKAEVLRV